MSKVVRLSDAQLRQLEEYKKLRLSALQLYFQGGNMSDRAYLDARYKITELVDNALLSDCLTYALNSLKYDEESLRQPDPEPPFPTN